MHVPFLLHSVYGLKFKLLEAYWFSVIPTLLWEEIITAKSLLPHYIVLQSRFTVLQTRYYQNLYYPIILFWCTCLSCAVTAIWSLSPYCRSWWEWSLLVSIDPSSWVKWTVIFTLVAVIAACIIVVFFCPVLQTALLSFFHPVVIYICFGVPWTTV
jgi:hypothetical protein